MWWPTERKKGRKTPRKSALVRAEERGMIRAYRHAAIIMSTLIAESLKARADAIEQAATIEREAAAARAAKRKKGARKCATKPSRSRR